MAGVSVKLFGYPYTLATDAKYGDIPCLVEAPQISAARFRIGDPVSSDQSCSMLLAGDPRVRAMLLQGRDSLRNDRLLHPLHPQDNFLYLEFNLVNMVGFWIGSEKVMITDREQVTDSRSPHYNLWRYTITRGVDGTPVSRVDLQDGIGPQVGLISSSLTFRNPPTPRGKWGEIRIHRDPGERCLNQDDPNHVHAEGCSRVVFTGQISRVVDAGDTIELEMQSGIQTLLDQAWPTIPALPVMSQTVMDNILTHTGVDLKDPITATTTHSNGRKWETYIAGLDDVIDPFDPLNRTEYRAFRELVLSTGPVYFSDLVTHEREVLPTKVSDALSLPYSGTNHQADIPDNWPAVVVLGTDGQREGVGTSAANAATSSQEYIVLGLEYMGSRTDSNPVLRPWEVSLPSPGVIMEPLGTYGYRMPQDPGGTTTGYAAGWWPTRDDAISNTAPYNIRTGRLTDGDEYRTPAILSTNNAFRCFTWRAHTNDLPSTPDTQVDWWLPQLWSPWVPEENGRPSLYIDHGMSGIAHLVVDLPTSASRLASIFGQTWHLYPDIYALPYGLIRREGTESPDTAVLPPEYWYQKTLKDSFFNDLWVSRTICWAPGKGGKLRPFSLSETQIGKLYITRDDLRSRDATLNFSFDRPLSGATISGLPKNFRVRDLGTGNVWMPGQEPIIIRSVEGSGGRAVSLKGSQFLRNDGLLRGPQTNDTRNSVARFLRLFPLRWRTAVSFFSDPAPEITLRIDGDLDVYPGDFVNLVLPNVIGPYGFPIGGQRALCLERGDDLSDATAECTFLLSSWFED